MTTKPVFMTLDAHSQLEAELEQLERVTQVELAQRLAAAMELGDVAENVEYHAVRDEASFVVGRILELQQMLGNAHLIPTQAEQASDIVQLSSMVTVRDDEGAEDTYQIRGSVEANPGAGIISNESPLGQALLGKCSGDTVTVECPAGVYRVTVIDVS